MKAARGRKSTCEAAARFIVTRNARRVRLHRDACELFAHACRSLQLHGNPLSAELMRDGRMPVVCHQDGVLKWVNNGLTTDEMQQRLLALTDAQCAAVTQCVAVCAACGWRC